LASVLGTGTYEKEPGPEALRGYACLIGGGPDFFIASRAHKEWGNAHTVFGEVTEASMVVVDTVTEEYPVHRELWGQTNVTVLDERLAFAASLKNGV
jgi:hypothetical protein